MTSPEKVPAARVTATNVTSAKRPARKTSASNAAPIARSAFRKHKLLDGRTTGLHYSQNLEGAVASHLSQIVGWELTNLDFSGVNQKLREGHQRLHGFESKSALEDVQSRQSREARLATRGKASAKRQKKKGPGISGLTAKTQDGIVRRFVKGEYGDVDLMFGKEEHAVSAVNTVTRQLNKNGTFTARDGQRVRDKLLALLPKVPAPRKPAATT